MMTALRPRDGIGALRRFVRAEPVEACEFCNVAIPAEHRHLVEPTTRRMLCACRVCAEAVADRPDRIYRLVPREGGRLADFRMTDAQWHALGLPIEMAFLYHSTPAGRPIALYPGPVGAAESPIEAGAWSALVAQNPSLGELEPDVEALLINRLKGRRAYSPGANRPLLCAGRPHSDALARLGRRRRGVGRDRQLLQRARREPAGAGWSV
jgi:hypothetical protein